MAAGKIPYSRSFYKYPQRGSGSSGITLISPTEQQVQIAMSEMKRNAQRKRRKVTPKGKSKGVTKKPAKPKPKPKSKPRNKKV